MPVSEPDLLFQGASDKLQDLVKTDLAIWQGWVGEKKEKTADYTMGACIFVFSSSLY